MIVVVGGHSRGIGKTQLGTSLIRQFPLARWNAVRIAGNGYQAEVTDCSGFLLREEPMANGRTDEGRYLAAGALRSYHLEARKGCLEPAMPSLHKIIAAGDHTLLESNTVCEFLKADLSLFVMDFAEPYWKASASKVMACADAIIIVDTGAVLPPWDLPPQWHLGKPLFRVPARTYMSPELATFLASRLLGNTTVQ